MNIRTILLLLLGLLLLVVVIIIIIAVVVIVDWYSAIVFALNHLYAELWHQWTMSLPTTSAGCMGIKIPVLVWGLSASADGAYMLRVTCACARRSVGKTSVVIHVRLSREAPWAA